MNIGNLINKKLAESKYENKKALYRDMKEIIGESCCAYNTFTEAINKNKNFSGVELLTLSALLDLDLNKLALHYIKSQRNILGNISIEEYLKQNKECILLYISHLLGDEYVSSELSKAILISTDKSMYFIYFTKKYNSVICYEFDIKVNSDDYLLRTKEIMKCDYFKMILAESGLGVDDFIKSDIHNQIEFLKKEGDIYYELFPELKQQIEDVYLSQFKQDILSGYIEEYIQENKNYLTRIKDDKIYSNIHSDNEEFGIDDVKCMLKDISKSKNLYLDGLLSFSEEAYSIFTEKALSILPILD